MSKMYELTVLIHPDLEANLDDALSKVKNIITEAGGKIEKENIWGKKKLAYQINREDFAVYVYFEVALPPEAPIVISNTLNITEEVLRYLLVSVDPKSVKAAEETEEKIETVETEEK
ncbi:30S ribosomal protein S6 [Candidatus Saccharibacteria bacterium]|jgi:small subunit ribosomal protein S6|nr:30S ribosomal protein S6 [Candidatus Saccharibacteria bacterium]MBP9986110.1 30S ribosomal protein S6 [Candidatus Saccharibacteria bacterium]